MHKGKTGDLEVVGFNLYFNFKFCIELLYSLALQEPELSMKLVGYLDNLGYVDRKVCDGPKACSVSLQR